MINTKKVVVIADYAFTTIGKNAFYGNKLTKITFPSTELTIHRTSFMDNPIINGGTYTYPDNVTVYCIPS